MDAVAWVSGVAAAVSAATTVILALLTARYVKLTHYMVEEARISKIPAVYVDLELDPGLSKFVIGNAGPTPALNIKLRVIRDAEWQAINGQPSGLAALSPFKKGIGYLAPGRSLKFFPGEVLDEAKFFGDDSRIEVALSFDTENGQHVEREAIFDLSSYSGVALESFTPRR